MEKLNQDHVEAALNVAARRAHANSERLGFITPGDISNEEYIVTRRDVLLANLGTCLVHWMKATQSIAKEHPLGAYIELGRLIDSIADVRESIAGRVDSAWFDGPATITHKQAMFSKMSLIVEEVGESVDCIILNNELSFRKELADVAVRLFDVYGAMLIDQGINMAKIVEQVMKTNEDRPVRHGKKKYT